MATSNCKGRSAIKRRQVASGYGYSIYRAAYRGNTLYRSCCPRYFNVCHIEVINNFVKRNRPSQAIYISRRVCGDSSEDIADTWVNSIGISKELTTVTCRQNTRRSLQVEVFGGSRSRIINSQATKSRRTRGRRNSNRCTTTISIRCSAHYRRASTRFRQGNTRCIASIKHIIGISGRYYRYRCHGFCHPAIECQRRWLCIKNQFARDNIGCYSIGIGC